MSQPTTADLTDQALDLIDRGDLPGANTLYEQICTLDPQNADARMMLGVIHMEFGDLAGAEASLLQALTLQPEFPEALCYLGNILRAQGKSAEAVSCLEQATQLQPDYAEAWVMLGGLQGLLGNYEQAETSSRRAVALLPQSVEAHMNLANAILPRGKLDEAAACYEKVIQLQPGLAVAWFMLGRTRGRQGLFDMTERCCHEAIRLNPSLTEAHLDLGNALIASGRLDEAMVVFNQVLARKPDLTEAHYCLGNALVARGMSDKAVDCYQRAIALKPDYPEAHGALGSAFQAQGRYQEALHAYKKSLELAPETAATHNNLSYVYKILGNLDEAEASLREALRLAPEMAEPHSNLGSLLELQGKVEEAVACFRCTLELKPDFAQAHSNLLLALNYLPEYGPEKIYEEHLAWARAHECSVPRVALPSIVPDTRRRLRVGYVSPDLHNHPVAFFVEPILKNHDRESFEVYCYADLAKADAVTERLRGHVDQWRDIYGLRSEQVAQQILSDKIDILVDLAGHTGNNRLLLFAMKPAPIQVTYLGYPTTTGLASMDYRLTDAVTDHADDARYYSEKLLYLKDGFCCYAPPPDAPDVSPLPARGREYVTFASFSNLVKINDRVMDLWCQVLRTNPTSRFVLYRHTLKGTPRDRFIKMFEERGIPQNRVDILGDVPAKYGHLPIGKRYLGLYGEIDIVLDTFPWNGHTITCENLWMGVPVVTLTGGRHVGRIGASVMKAIGLTDLVANSPDDYINIASRLARNLDGLEQLRASLRERMRQSRLCDGKQFTKNLEATYRDIWRQWCEKPTSR
jgi:predicted O-linked N-acetylglucosamine transferase (SPINDLY family)